MRSRRLARLNSGVSIVEAPVMLWVIFAFMLVPMLSMATVTLRYSLFNYLAVQAVHAAAKAKTFDTAEPGKVPAVQVAQNFITTAIRSFSGIQVSSVQTAILVSPVTGSTTTRFESHLATPANTETNVYQIETQVRGQVDPLLGMAPNFGTGIPGLTAPMLITCSAREMFENPQGLDR